MSQHDGNRHGPGEEEEFPLGEPGRTPADYEPAIYPRREPEEPAPGKEPFQFTLAELLGLTAGAAFFLGILACIPGGLSAEALAGTAGLGLLVSLLVVAVVQPGRPIVRLAWWMLLASYVLASLAAVVRSLL